MYPNEKYLKSTFRDHYVSWCNNNGYRALSTHNLTKELGRLGITPYKSNGIRYFMGILRQPSEHDTPYQCLVNKIKGL